MFNNYLIVSSLVDCLVPPHYSVTRIACYTPQCIYTSVCALTSCKNIDQFICADLCKPVYIEVHYDTPLFFGLTSFAMSLCLSARLISGFWLLLHFWLQLLPAPWYFLSSDFLVLDFIFDYSFASHFGTANLCLPGYPSLPEINNVLCICPGLHLAPLSDVTTTQPTRVLLLQLVPWHALRKHASLDFRFWILSKSQKIICEVAAVSHFVTR